MTAQKEYHDVANRLTSLERTLRRQAGARAGAPATGPEQTPPPETESSLADFRGRHGK